MALSSTDIQRVIDVAYKLDIYTPQRPIEDFFGDVLGLNAIQRASEFPDPDPTGIGAISIGRLTLARDELLRDKGQVPAFVIYRDKTANRTFISGIAAYLSLKGLPADSPPDFLKRIEKHQSIRKELLQIDKGHKLELVAAAILSRVCHYGEATKGSGDQGIDAIGWNQLIRIEDAFLDGLATDNVIRAGHRVMVVASSKAAIGSNPGDLKVINPAHIRELVGSWLIQRSESSVWKNLGVQLLTPLQLVLVTTYRLSEESKAECQRLGVQVWSIPELVYLICRYAPPEVFPIGRRPMFSPSKFADWWGEKQLTRLKPKFA
ncbi:hypothetical protein [Methylomonas fluvii]|uniref:Uncharacterized protein n=1 Tax=Methylomonas fluvii TaxID=1854564 RepID=A0ABR9DJG6_9GAMM|nr:hypothetical protein [Methylomonas fluvii]MBD9363006.1 hypothetical protein [Methylomonas fluvii]CAD6876207.1 hypothetical protein [Methylomonas fluvii]